MKHFNVEERYLLNTNHDSLYGDCLRLRLAVLKFAQAVNKVLTKIYFLAKDCSGFTIR